MNYTVILSISIRPWVTALGQPFWMAVHASDWGDSLNQHGRGGKQNTMVMMFVGIVVLIVDGTFCTIPTVANLRSGSFRSRRRVFCYHPNPNRGCHFNEFTSMTRKVITHAECWESQLSNGIRVGGSLAESSQRNIHPHAVVEIVISTEF